MPAATEAIHVCADQDGVLRFDGDTVDYLVEPIDGTPERCDELRQAIARLAMQRRLDGLSQHGKLRRAQAGDEVVDPTGGAR